MGVPTSEVGYTPVMPRREDHEVQKDMWWHWEKKRRKKTSGRDRLRVPPPPQLTVPASYRLETCE